MTADGEGRHDGAVAADRRLQRPLEREHLRQRRRHALLPPVGRRRVHGERERLDRRGVRHRRRYTFSTPRTGSPGTTLASPSAPAASAAARTPCTRRTTRASTRPTARTRSRPTRRRPAGGGLHGRTAAPRYLTSGASVAIATTPYSDGGSGIASEVLTVQSATLAADSCGTFGSTVGRSAAARATASRTATATGSRSPRPTASATRRRSRRRSRSTRRHRSRRRSRSPASRAATRS